jgi:hypothetical protein
MNKFNDAYKQIVSEDESLDRWNQQQIEKEEEYNNSVDNNKPSEKPSVDDFFEMYEEIGMSSEMAIDEAIESISEMISKEVPVGSQMTARIAVKKLWQEKIKDWRS